MSDASSRRGGKLRTAVIDWLRRLFSSGDREEEAAEREEYGLPPRNDVERPGQYESFAGAEAVQVAEDELDEFKAPGDPAP
jgi:hypothetical protein